MLIGPKTRRSPAPIKDAGIAPESGPPGIPRIIHQIWLGGHAMPPRWAAFADRLRALHPGWEYRLWTDADVPALLTADTSGAATHYTRWNNFGFRSDLLRLMVLRRHGGVYLDTDCEPLRPLDGLVTGPSALIGATFEPQPIRECLVENAVIGSCAHHPFIGLALARIAEACAGISDGDFAAGRPNVVFLTGPAFLSSRLLEYRQSPESPARDVCILPGKAFYPVTPGGPLQGRDLPPTAPGDYPGSWCIHWWDGSWVRQQEAQRAFDKTRN